MNMDKPGARSIFYLFATRRQVLKGAGAAALAGGLLPFDSAAGAVDEPATVLETLDDLFCVYVNRASGRVAAVKPFADVNPEIKAGKKAATPYKPPTENVYLGNAGTVFRRNVRRFGIVDIGKRNEGLGFFSSLKDSYRPGEYTHHFLLTLADRELGREELGNWALANARGNQKTAALALLHRVHGGYNGKQITGNREKMAEATRYYTGREVLKPMLFLGTAPKVGGLAATGRDGIQVASLEDVRLALADSGAATGGVAIGSEAAANDICVAAESAIEGVSSVGASIGNAASVGASCGAGDAGSGGDSSSPGGSTSGGGSSGGGSGGLADRPGAQGD